MKKAILTLHLALSLSLSVHAQKIKVASKVLDIGQVQFYVPASGMFELENSGKKDLVITKVDTGCGCAVASYPTRAIKPGEKFVIKVTYDARMMGHFDKIVDVYCNASAKPVTLELRGEVLEEVEDYIGNFPFRLGALTADCNAVEFEDVRLGEVFQQKFHIYNPTGKPVQPQMMHLPNYLKAEVSPSTVAANRSAEVTITLDSRFMHDYGLEETQIYLGANPGERVSASKQIKVSAVLLPEVKELTEAQEALAPKLQISDTQVSLPVADGKKKSAAITLRNTGRTKLDILNIQILSEGIGVELNKRSLAPSEEARLKITTDPKRLKNVTDPPQILIVTNAPATPKVVITVFK